MRIDDFREGTAFIKLCKSQFTNANDFEGLCRFLKLPETCTTIEINVEEGTYVGY